MPTPISLEWGCDLQTEHERYLTEQIFQRPVFVTDYPKEIKAFYMKLNPDGKTVAAMDCLVPGIGEISGGSQREENLELLIQRMEETGMNTENYDFYLDLRKYGSTRHAGFGLGFERCVMYLTGISNIRDVIPFPRTTGNCGILIFPISRKSSGSYMILRFFLCIIIKCLKITNYFTNLIRYTPLADFVTLDTLI